MHISSSSAPSKSKSGSVSSASFTMTPVSPQQSSRPRLNRRKSSSNIVSSEKQSTSTASTKSSDPFHGSSQSFSLDSPRQGIFESKRAPELNADLFNMFNASSPALGGTVPPSPRHTPRRSASATVSTDLDDSSFSEFGEVDWDPTAVQQRFPMTRSSSARSLIKPSEADRKTTKRQVRQKINASDLGLTSEEMKDRSKVEQAMKEWKQRKKLEASQEGNHSEKVLIREGRPERRKSVSRRDVGSRSRSRVRGEGERSKSRSKSREDTDGEKRSKSRSKSREDDGEKRSKSRSKSREDDGEKRSKSRSKSREVDGEARSKSRSKSREDDGKERSKSRSKSREDDGKERSKSRSKSREDDGKERSKSRSKSREDDGKERSKSRSKTHEDDGKERSKSRSRSRDDPDRAKSRSKSRPKSREDNKPILAAKPPDYDKVRSVFQSPPASQEHFFTPISEPKKKRPVAFGEDVVNHSDKVIVTSQYNDGNISPITCAPEIAAPAAAAPGPEVDVPDFCSTDGDNIPNAFRGGRRRSASPINAGSGHSSKGGREEELPKSNKPNSVQERARAISRRARRASTTTNESKVAMVPLRRVSNHGGS